VERGCICRELEKGKGDRGFDPGMDPFTFIQRDCTHGEHFIVHGGSSKGGGSSRSLGTSPAKKAASFRKLTTKRERQGKKKKVLEKIVFTHPGEKKKGCLFFLFRARGDLDEKRDRGNGKERKEKPFESRSYSGLWSLRLGQGDGEEKRKPSKNQINERREKQSSHPLQGRGRKNERRAPIVGEGMKRTQKQERKEKQNL